MHHPIINEAQSSEKLKASLDFAYKVIHCPECVSANIRPHELHWGDQEMGTAFSYHLFQSQCFPSKP